MKTSKYILIVSLALFFLACGDSDTNPPVISLTSPTEGQIFTNADTVVQLRGTVVDDVSLNRVVLNIEDANENVRLNETITSFPVNDTYELSFNINVADLEAGEFDLKVSATDDNDNASEKVVSFVKF